MRAIIPRTILATLARWHGAHAERWHAPRKSRSNPNPNTTPPAHQWIHVTVDGGVATLAILVGSGGARLAVPLVLQDPESGAVALLAAQAGELAKDKGRGPAVAIEHGRAGATVAGVPVESADPSARLALGTWGPGEGAGSTVQLPAGLILELIRAVIPASALDDTRPALASVRLEREADRVTAIATDGHRLASHDRALPIGEGWEANIPRKLAAILADWIAYAIKARAMDQAQPITLRLSERGCAIDAAGLTVAWHAADVGQFPPWRQVVPSLDSTSIRLEMDRAELRGAVAAALADYRIASKGGSSKPLAILTFRAVDPPEGYEAGQAHTPSGECPIVLGTVTRELSPIAGRYDGAWPNAGRRRKDGTAFPLMPVGFNAAYLGDALDALDAVDPPRKGQRARVRVALGGELDPCLVGAPGSAGIGIVVMPVRL